MKVNRKKVIVIGVVLVAIVCFAWGGVFLYHRYKYFSLSRTGNKSLDRTDSYPLENETTEKYMHFSLDDVIVLFQDLTEMEESYQSIFDNETLRWLRDLHDQYGLIVSCYVYFQTSEFTMNDCTSKFRPEFEKNADWLKFGFHTRNENTTYEKASPEELRKDYKEMIEALRRVVGERAIDHVIRIQSFTGNKDAIHAIATTDMDPIVGLFTADGKRQSYYLCQDDNDYIYCHDKLRDDELKLTFYSTDLRIEMIENMDEKIGEFSTEAWNNQLGELMVFAHVWAVDEKVKRDINKLCKWAVDHKYKFEFPEKRGLN